MVEHVLTPPVFVGEPTSSTPCKNINSTNTKTFHNKFQHMKSNNTTSQQQRTNKSDSENQPCQTAKLNTGIVKPKQPNVEVDEDNTRQPDTQQQQHPDSRHDTGVAATHQKSDINNSVAQQNHDDNGRQHDDNNDVGTQPHNTATPQNHGTATQHNNTTPQNDSTKQPPANSTPTPQHDNTKIDVSASNKIKMRPLLKGSYHRNQKDKIVFEGMWGLDEQAFLPNGYLSRFHYERVRDLEGQKDVDAFPRDGLYNGYFLMGSTIPGAPPTRHSEKGIAIKFVSSGKVWTVNGGGKNQFGSYTLDGTYDPSTNQMELYRNYVSLSPRARRVEARISVHNHTRTPIPQANASSSVGPGKHGGRQGVPTIATDNQQNPPPSRCGRVRRLPSHLKAEDDSKPDLYTRMTQILDCVSSADLNKWFLVPVDAEALGILDYHDVIKHPMDLGTVRNQVQAKAYEAATDFAKDVRLTFQNAMTFNPAKHPVHVAAAGLLKLFERKYKELLNPNKKQPQDAGSSSSSANEKNPSPKRKKPTRKSRSSSSHKSRKQEVNDIRLQLQMMNEELNNLKNNPANASNTMMFMDDDDDEDIDFMAIGKPPKRAKLHQANFSSTEDLTYQEKEDLGLNIHCLPSEQLEEVITIIAQSGATITNDAGEVELDFDEIDTATLRKLQQYVA